MHDRRPPPKPADLPSPLLIFHTPFPTEVPCPYQNPTGPHRAARSSPVPRSPSTVREDADLTSPANSNPGATLSPQPSTSSTANQASTGYHLSAKPPCRAVLPCIVAPQPSSQELLCPCPHHGQKLCQAVSSTTSLDHLKAAKLLVSCRCCPTFMPNLLQLCPCQVLRAMNWIDWRTGLED